MTKRTIDSVVGKVEGDSTASPTDQPYVPYWLALREKYKRRIYCSAYLTSLIVAMGFVLGRRFVRGPGFQVDWYWFTVYSNALAGPAIVAFMIATDRKLDGAIEKLAAFALSGFLFYLIYMLAFGFFVNVDMLLR